LLHASNPGMRCASSGLRSDKHPKNQCRWRWHC
jgi:hypothetical protein